jgi:hypothetical protein
MEFAKRLLINLMAYAKMFISSIGKYAKAEDRNMEKIINFLEAKQAAFSDGI